MKYNALVVALVCWPALASQPGQPLDCSDWVYVQPGLSCVQWVAPSTCAAEPNGPFCLPTTSSAVFDNEGNQYSVRVLPGGATCCVPNGSCSPCQRYEIVAFNGIGESV